MNEHQSQPDTREAVIETATFLLARLEEYDPGGSQSEREFYGHVAPAIARLRGALRSSTGEPRK
jgi:hypothetical protein